MGKSVHKLWSVTNSDNLLNFRWNLSKKNIRSLAALEKRRLLI